MVWMDLLTSKLDEMSGTDPGGGVHMGHVTPLCTSGHLLCYFLALSFIVPFY